MKYKHKLERLAGRQKAWQASGNSNQNATTKPGSQKK